MTLADARKKFIDLRVMRQNGVNPKQFVQQEQEQHKNTVKDLILNWYSNYVERHRKQPLQIKQQIDADILPNLGNKELNSIQTRSSPFFAVNSH